MSAITFCPRDYLENFGKVLRVEQGGSLEYVTYFVHFILEIGKKFRTFPWKQSEKDCRIR